MHKILITGAGKIGTLIACLLQTAGDYDVRLADISFNGHDLERLKKANIALNCVELDVSNHEQMAAYLKANPVDAIISSLPYFCNAAVAKLAKEFNLHYFDLTEDVQVTHAVKEIARHAKSAFVPQCGLAPGFISIVANHLIQQFSEVDTVKMRVGALPINASNVLQYSLTWSTDGVINEYGNPCYGIEHGQTVMLHPLEGLEKIVLDGIAYEAFNTSGGLGSLAEIHAGKVKTMNYKTMRYPGHCDKMRLLMNDLKLNSDRATLKKILERAVPKTYQDEVIVYVSVTGLLDNVFIEKNYVKKVYPQTIAGLEWSAIQVTTSSGVCAVVDLVLNNANNYQGFVHQEQFELKQFLDNRFGKYFA